MRVNISRRKIGVNFTETGEAEVVVWSPLAKSVELVSGQNKIALSNNFGYWTATTRHISPGTKYKISVDGNEPLPDPASLAQPEDVHGPSAAIDLN